MSDFEIKLTLGEGDTSISKHLISNKDIYIKHEEENPTQSFKDRSLAYQLSYYLNSGKTKFAISSSGNAAISAATYLKGRNCKLDIFVSTSLEFVKLKKLEALIDSDISIHKSLRPKSDSIKFCAENGATNLIGSKDDNAIIGFKTIAYEIAEKLPEADAIFIPCSSGTSTIGINAGFLERRMNVAIHICQTTKINSIARNYDKLFESSENSLANAITDRIASRKTKVQDIINISKGYGWVISDEEILSAENIALNIFNLESSYNSLLALAGFLKAQNAGFRYKSPILLFSGL